MLDALQAINTNNLLLFNYDPLKEFANYLISNANLTNLSIKTLSNKVENSEKLINDIYKKLEKGVPKDIGSIQPNFIANSEQVKQSDFTLAIEKINNKMQELDIELKKLKITAMQQLSKAKPKEEKMLELRQNSAILSKGSSEILYDSSDIFSERIGLLKLELKSHFAPLEQQQYLIEQTKLLQNSIDTIEKKTNELSKKITENEKQSEILEHRISEDKKPEDDKNSNKNSATATPKTQKIVMHTKDDKSFKMLTKKVVEIEAKMKSDELRIDKCEENVDQLKLLNALIDKKADIIEFKMQRSEISNQFTR